MDHTEQLRMVKEAEFQMMVKLAGEYRLRGYPDAYERAYRAVYPPSKQEWVGEDRS